jgi:uncharacterized protein (TIGR04540 family)
MISFYKNQLELSLALKNLIDKYWDFEIEEDKFIELIKSISYNNKELLFKNEDYTSIVKLKLGIKRLNLVDKIIGYEVKGRGKRE